jgi:hypothetical protein
MVSVGLFCSYIAPLPQRCEHVYSFFWQEKMDALENVATEPGVQIITSVVHRSMPSVHGFGVGG